MFILVPVVVSYLCTPVTELSRSQLKPYGPDPKMCTACPFTDGAGCLNLAFPPVTSVHRPGCPCFIPQEIGWQPCAPCATLLVLRTFLTSAVKRAGVEKPSIPVSM